MIFVPQRSSVLLPVVRKVQIREVSQISGLGMDDLFNLFRVASQPSANSSFAALLECPLARVLSGPLEHFDCFKSSIATKNEKI